jgi:hypothetical protein
VIALRPFCTLKVLIARFFFVAFRPLFANDKGDNEKGDVENQIAVLSSGNELEGASSPQLAGNELGEFTEDPNIGSAVV